MKRGAVKRLFFLLTLMLTLAALSAALGEVSVSLSVDQPRVGEIVDVVVEPDGDAPQGVSYALYYGEDKVFAGKPADRYTASFRPRKEGTYTLRITVSYGKNGSDTAEIPVPVSGEMPAPESESVVYSQRDGWWAKTKYADGNLQKGGCAVFTISHALQRLGFTGEDVTPAKLARAYSYFYTAGKGTYNEGLVNQVCKDYGFTSQSDLITSKKTLADCLRRGDLFSFSIVDNHIALADGISEDGTKVHIVDSATSVTFERIRQKDCIFFTDENGEFVPAQSPEDLPGNRWYFETKEFGGMEYWMSIDYCALRGMRLIRTPWLKADLGEGPVGVDSVEYTGAGITKIVVGKDTYRVPTRDLIISGKQQSAPQIALVTAKKGTYLLDGDGKRLKGEQGGTYLIKRQNMVLLLEAKENSLYASWNGVFGYLDPEAVTLLPLPEAGEQIRTAVITQNGNTSGGSQVTVHLEPKKNSTGLIMWKTGTPVVLLEKQDSYWLTEGKGLRGWVHEKYILPDEE